MNLTTKCILILIASVFGFLFLPLLASVCLTVGGCVYYVHFMVKNNKTKPKRKSKSKEKPDNPEPIKQEEPKLRMEDYPIA